MLLGHIITHKGKHTMKKLLVITAAAVLLVGCTRRAQLTVVNGSPTTLTNIVASGSGFSVPFGALAPGAQQQVTLSPRANDKGGIKLEFDANGKHFSEMTATDHDPWSGMREVILTVRTNFSLSYSAITTF